MKTPKQRFLELKAIAEKHRDTVDNSQFLVAMDMALLDMIWNTPKGDDVQAAAANHWMLHGALTYMKKLANLGEVSPEKPLPPDDNLIHRK